MISANYSRVSPFVFQAVFGILPSLSKLLCSISLPPIH